MSVLVRLWWKLSACCRRLALAAIHVNDPWDDRVLNLQRPAVRKMLARGILDRRREAGARIVRKYSTDPVVERRERLVEQRNAGKVVTFQRDRKRA